MTRTTLEPGDFTIAGRQAASQPLAPEVEKTASDLEPDQPSLVDSDAQPAPPRHNRKSTIVSQQKSSDDAAARQAASQDLKDLKRTRQREIKFYVNVALDGATKQRLKRAATDHDVKMTAIIKAALSAYLSHNGY